MPHPQKMYSLGKMEGPMGQALYKKLIGSGDVAQGKSLLSTHKMLGSAPSISHKPGMAVNLNNLSSQKMETGDSKLKVVPDYITS